MTAYAIATPGQRVRPVSTRRISAGPRPVSTPRAASVHRAAPVDRPASDNSVALAGSRATVGVTRTGRYLHATPTPAARARRMTLVVIVLAVLAMFAPRAFAGDEQGSAVMLDTYTVAQGESLWSIASALTVPGDDVQETVSTLQTLNTMSGSSLRVGDQLVIPALDR